MIISFFNELESIYIETNIAIIDKKNKTVRYYHPTQNSMVVVNFEEWPNIKVFFGDGRAETIKTANWISN